MAEDPHQESINLLTYRINSLTTELTAARAKIERIDLSGIHTCHDKCQRWTCVLMRENKMLTEQRDGLRSGIDYASDQLHKVTEQRDRLAANNNRVIELLKDGLQTDGSHHKQWYLNEVLKLINADIAKDVEMHWTHDKGIAP